MLKSILNNVIKQKYKRFKKLKFLSFVFVLINMSDIRIFLYNNITRISQEQIIRVTLFLKLKSLGI